MKRREPPGMTFYVTIRSLESRELGHGDKETRAEERGKYWDESRVRERKENILSKQLLEYKLFKINRPGVAGSVLSIPL